MATTSPDNIWTPDSGDAYALTVDLAATADTVQEALTNLSTRFPASVSSAAQRNALFPSPVQGNRVFRTDLGYQETYLAVYNASTNPSGASASGWYPTRRMFFANRTGTQSFAANWNTLGSAITQTRNDGLGVFTSNGIFTVTAGGTYILSASVYLTNPVQPNAVQILRNSATPDSNAVLAAGIIDGASSRGGFRAENTVTLNAGDAIRVMVYAGSTAGNSVNTALGIGSASFSIEKI